MSESFQQFVGAFGSYSWVVLFANSPIDPVSDAYAMLSGRTIARHIPVALSKHDLFGPTGAIVRVSGSEWTVVFHLVGSWDQFQTAAFSQTLDARVLEFCGDDTSGAVQCKLFTPGEDCTVYQTSSDSEYEDGLYDEMAEYADEAGLEMAKRPQSVVVAGYEELFQSLGIWTVRLSLNDNREVLATADNKSRIKRVDLAERPA